MTDAVLTRETDTVSVTEPVESSPGVDAETRAAQRLWAALPVRDRLTVMRRARASLASMAEALAAAMPAELARSPAVTRVAELLPLLAAAEFLERNAAEILQSRRLGRSGRPLWLAGVDTQLQRVPFGTVLVIAPANYPLFLPGVTALQALAAGNAVVWKPGRGGKPIAERFAAAMIEAGLPTHLLQVTEDSVAAGVEALAGKVDKIVFTGSATSAKAVLRAAAERLIPCVVEASGCDAVVILPSADIERVVKALTFGMRLNGSATCMAPRRLLVLGDAAELIARLKDAFAAVPAVKLPSRTREHLRALMHDAKANGANVIGELAGTNMQPILVANATPALEIARTDIFAPVLSLIHVANWQEVLDAQEACPFALTAAIFGDESEARRLAATLEVGTVLNNDVIVSTADPRTPFGGRRRSGFGATQGAEGLLEMTAAKVISAQRGKTTRQYEAADSETHIDMFDGLIAAGHSRGWMQRFRGLVCMVRAASNLQQK